MVQERIRLYFIVSFLVIASMVSAGASELTLDECVTRALRHNTGLRATRSGQTVAEQGVVAARAGFLPNISSTITSRELDNFGASSGSGIDGNNSVASITVAQPLFTFGKRSNAYELAQLGVDDAVHAETVAANELVFQVTQTYQDALLAREMIRIAEDAYALADSQARYAEKRFRQGYVSEFDFLRAKTNRAGKEPAIIAARNQYAVACDKMLTLLGDAALTAFAPRGGLTYELQTLGESQAVAVALARNPQLAKLRVALQVQEASIAYAQAQHFPDLNASYTYNRQRTDYEMGGRELPVGYYSDWSAGVVLSIPIFSGFATQAGVDKARAQQEQLRDIVRQSEEQLALEVRTIVKRLQENAQVIASAEEAVRLAERSLRMARVSYDNGLSTTLDVQQAEVALTQARTDYARSVYGYRVNTAALDAVLGNNAEHIRAINPAANRGTGVILAH